VFPFFLSNSSCRFLFGGDQGRLRFPPPDGHSPLVECLQPTQVLCLDPCFYFGDLMKGVLSGPLYVEDDVAFVPKPVETANVKSFTALISSFTFVRGSTILNFNARHVQGFLFSKMCPKCGALVEVRLYAFMGSSQPSVLSRAFRFGCVYLRAVARQCFKTMY